VSTPAVAIVHDYVTQRGGAERVVLAMLRAFPGAPLYTSLYEPSTSYGEYADVGVRTLPIDRVGFLRGDHRRALPLLAPAFSSLHVPADVVVCSSSGWAHGARTDGRKIVYCYSPAKWLHQPRRYFGRSLAMRAASGGIRSMLLPWDRAAAASAHRYLVVSTVVQRWVREAYDIEADIVPPPFTVRSDGGRRPVEGVEPGFHLAVSRLLPYKNVDVVVEAFRQLPGERLVVVGSGPLEAELRRTAPANVTLLGAVDDDELRWLYANSSAHLTASYEDFGLTPLEAGSFGKPSGVLRWGGFLDTVVEGRTGLFFDEPTPDAVARCVRELALGTWDPAVIVEHAGGFAEDRFAERLQAVVLEAAGVQHATAGAPPAAPVVR
jgi:glycosyltransferase involved in cell wall biosynthesis